MHYIDLHDVWMQWLLTNAAYTKQQNQRGNYEVSGNFISIVALEDKDAKLFGLSWARMSHSLCHCR